MNHHTISFRMFSTVLRRLKLEELIFSVFASFVMSVVVIVGLAPPLSKKGNKFIRIKDHITHMETKP